MILRRPDFPGMDPWLEHPALWPDVHNRLIVAIADAMAEQLDPRYFVGVESRTTVLARGESPRLIRPDVLVRPGDPATQQQGATRATAVLPEAGPGVEVEEFELGPEESLEEWFLEVREVPSRRVVTVLEVLSPTNKSSADGRGQYLAKRLAVLGSGTSLVEIDLLRGGQPMPGGSEGRPGDYRIMVSRRSTRPRALLYRFSVRQPIPPVPVPLLPPDADASLDLNSALHALIGRARYHRQVDYSLSPVPPLRPADADWAAAIVRRASDSA